MSRFLFFSLLLFSSLYSGENSIVVQLPTSCPQTPIFLAPLSSQESELSEKTQQALLEVLQWDLDQGGGLTQVSPTADRLQLLKKDPFEQLTPGALWQRQGVAYVIKIRFKERHLSARIGSTVTGKVQGIDGLPLTGELSHDRQQMHRLADAIHQEILGIPGIASTRILYAWKLPLSGQGEQKEVSEVWESDYDGHNAHPITSGAQFCVTPQYLAAEKGKQSGSFFYVSYKTGQPKIYLKPLKGGKEARLTFLGGNQFMPCLSPTREHVAFVCDAAGNPDLFLLPFHPQSGPKGKPIQIFSSRAATQASPTFHPNGKQIAFVSNRGGPPRVYVMDVPLTPAQQRHPQPLLITKKNRENTAPAWSPDGKSIAYSAKTEGVRQIWLYDVAKEEERQLTFGPGHKENPSWAPNSKHLVFNHVDGHHSELFLLSLLSGKTTQITEGEGEKRYPCWDPSRSGL